MNLHASLGEWSIARPVCCTLAQPVCLHCCAVYTPRLCCCPACVLQLLGLQLLLLRWFGWEGLLTTTRLFTVWGVLGLFRMSVWRSLCVGYGLVWGMCGWVELCVWCSVLLQTGATLRTWLCLHRRHECAGNCGGSAPFSQGFWRGGLLPPFDRCFEACLLGY